VWLPLDGTVCHIPYVATNPAVKIFGVPTAWPVAARTKNTVSEKKCMSDIDVPGNM